MHAQLRRALVGLSLTTAALATVATSPKRWNKTVTGVPFHAVLDPSHNRVELHFNGTLTLAHPTQGSPRFWLAAVTTATATGGAPGESRAFRLQMIPSSEVAAGHASPAAQEITAPTTGPVRSVAMSQHLCTQCQEGYTLAFSRTGTFTSTLTVDGTLELEVGDIGDEPAGATVTLVQTP